MPFGLARRVDPASGFSVDGAVLALGFLAVVVAGCALVAVTAWHEIGRDARGWKRGARFASRIAGVASAPLTVAAGLRLGFDRGEGTRAIPVGTTLLAATLAVAGSCCALLYGASLQRMIDQPAARGWKWDVTVGGTRQLARPAGCRRPRCCRGACRDARRSRIARSKVVR